MLFSKGEKAVHWRKTVFSQILQGQHAIHAQKNKTGFLSYTMWNRYLKMDHRSSVTATILKLLEENGCKSLWLWIRQKFILKDTKDIRNLSNNNKK